MVLSLLLGRPWIAPALAADPAEVEELIRQGVDLRRMGRDPLAIPLFQRAYDLDRTARTAAQLGLVEAAVGYWISAEKHLAEALASPRHPWLVKNMEEIRKTLVAVRLNICEVDLVGAPAGAEVIVNGRPLGRLPLAEPVRVPEGSVHVIVRAVGYLEFMSSTQVQGGRAQHIPISLVPSLDYQQSQMPQLQHAPTGMNPRPPVGSLQSTAPHGYYPGQPPGQPADVGAVQWERGRSSSSWVRPAAWVAASLALVGSGVGLYGLVQQRESQERFDGHVRPGTVDRPCGTKATNRGGYPCSKYYDDAEAAGLLATVGLVSGGALATAAIVAFLLSADGSEDDRLAAGSSLALRLSPGQASLGWSLRF